MIPYQPEAAPPMPDDHDAADAARQAPLTPPRSGRRRRRRRRRLILTTPKKNARLRADGHTTILKRAAPDDRLTPERLPGDGRHGRRKMACLQRRPCFIATSSVRRRETRGSIAGARRAFARR